jgi:hypothetical protein
MKNKLPFRELANVNLLNNLDWSKYTNKNGPIPEKHAKVLSLVAQYYFYLGDLDHAREVSYKSSVYLEERAESRFSRGFIASGVSDLFDSALYRSLAQKDDALKLWQGVVEKRRLISETQILEQLMAHIWIYEAYALAKLKRYVEVYEPVEKGLDGINNGKSIYDTPSKNLRVYDLARVLMKLASYQIEKNRETQKNAQSALLEYKKKNSEYSRAGYDIIFDLQFSYPDVFEPVLPGKDPDED